VTTAPGPIQGVGAAEYVSDYFADLNYGALFVGALALLWTFVCLVYVFGWPSTRPLILRYVNPAPAIDLFRERVAAMEETTKPATDCSWTCRACGGTDALEEPSNVPAMRQRRGTIYS
jgi:hypothetical protein